MQTFNDLLGWANCTGGWQTLPSGNIVCYVGQALTYQNRSDYCKNLGGYILEIHTREDSSALAYYIWKLIMYYGKSNSTLIATGAQSVSNNGGNDSVLLWTNSREYVDYSQHGTIQSTGNFTPSPQPGQILFLQSLGFTSNFTPNFALKGLLNSDAKTEFICMKPGTVHTILIF